MTQKKLANKWHVILHPNGIIDLIFIQICEIFVNVSKQTIDIVFLNISFTINILFTS